MLVKTKMQHPIPVPLIVDFKKGRQGGHGWHGVVFVGRSHGEGLFEDVLRVIYRSTYVGIVFRSLNFGTSIFLMSTSKTIEIIISTSVPYHT